MRTTAPYRVTVAESLKAMPAAVGRLPLLAAVTTLILGAALGVAITVTVREQATITGTRVILCGDARPMCPPDTDRVVLGQWSDGELRLSQYTPVGWAPAGERAWYPTGHYVVSWRELP